MQCGERRRATGSETAPLVAVCWLQPESARLTGFERTAANGLGCRTGRAPARPDLWISAIALPAVVSSGPASVSSSRMDGITHDRRSRDGEIGPHGPDRMAGRPITQGPTPIAVPEPTNATPASTQQHRNCTHDRRGCRAACGRRHSYAAVVVTLSGADEPINDGAPVRRPWVKSCRPPPRAAAESVPIAAANLQTS